MSKQYLKFFGSPIVATGSEAGILSGRYVIRKYGLAAPDDIKASTTGYISMDFEMPRMDKATSDEQSAIRHILVIVMAKCN